MCMDDIKISAKHEREVEFERQTISVFTLDIGIKFGIEQCVKLIMKKKKERRNNRKNWLVHSRKYQNSKRKEK